MFFMKIILLQFVLCKRLLRQHLCTLVSLSRALLYHLAGETENIIGQDKHGLLLPRLMYLPQLEDVANLPIR